MSEENKRHEPVEVRVFVKKDGQDEHTCQMHILGDGSVWVEGDDRDVIYEWADDLVEKATADVLSDGFWLAAQPHGDNP